MAQQLYFTRDTKMFLVFNGYAWHIPILDGFSFSQATNSSEIVLSEMESASGSRRGRRAFNDSLAPAEWSFSTYVRPFTTASTSDGSAFNADDGSSNQKIHAVEEALWALMAGADGYDRANFDFENAATVIGQADLVEGDTYEIVTAGSTNWTSIGASAGTVGTVFTRNSTTATGSGGEVKRKVSVPTTTGNTINFKASNRGQLTEFKLYFIIGDANKRTMKMDGCTVNEASIDFDVDGIATINWSGFANNLTDFTANTVHQDAAPSSGTGAVVGDIWIDTNTTTPDNMLYECTAAGANHTVPITEGYDDTESFIRNKISTVRVIADTAADGQSGLEGNSGASYSTTAGYELTLTGGNITISNNMTYLTPEELGTVNVPFANVTGTRSVNGSFTCYLTDDTSTTDASVDFYDDLRGISSVVTNSFGIYLHIGGTSGRFLRVNLPQCHLEIPTHAVDDLISVETNFMALPSTIDQADEITLVYDA